VSHFVVEVFIYCRLLSSESSGGSRCIAVLSIIRIETSVLLSRALTRCLYRLERILTMVYVVQNYWAYFGLYPSSGMYICMYIYL
jgi:hypothetical protein